MGDSGKKNTSARAPKQERRPRPQEESDDHSAARCSEPAVAQAAPSAEPGAGRERLLFYAALLVLTAFCMWPIWATRLLPMQDYPQHLFLARVMATYHDPSFNWREFYRVDLAFRPYMLWYLAMKLLAGIFNIEAAGKILFSLYILLIAILTLVARRLAPRGGLPWGALLLFPFAFNQMYFLGFPNYIISLPVIFLALLDLDSFRDGLTLGKVLRHGLYLALLFLNHPYSLLVYIALSATSATVIRQDRQQFLRSLMPAAVMSVIFAAWYLLQHGPSSTPTSVPWGVRWLPPQASLAHYLLQFTGMRLFNGPNWVAVALWGMVAAMFCLAWKRNDRERRCMRRFKLWYYASFIGILMLPFWLGYYSYFNLRLAPVSYFALALLLCCVRVPLRHTVLLTVSLLALLVQSIQLQKALAVEVETILPLVSAAQKNALVLPLVFDPGSSIIEPYFFNQVHVHDSDYFQLLVGGGATPTLFPNAMMPVQYQPGVMLPYPKKPDNFSWKEHGAYYDYVLVRGAPKSVQLDLARHCDLVSQSGSWWLYRNKATRAHL